MMQASENSERLFRFVKKYVYQYKAKPFRLASGKQSNHYFNCKRITMHPEYLELLVTVFRDEIIPRSPMPKPKAAGGLSLGADPIAYALSLAYWREKTLLYPVVVRKQIKKHGTGRRIEAEFGEKTITEILLLDDTVTTGGSALLAARALREAGLTIQHCLAVIDRKEGGSENLAKEGISLTSLFQGDQFWNE